jgi:thioredoxin reductase
MLGYDGRSPQELYRAGRDELAKYTSVEAREGEVTGGAVDGNSFELELADGSRVVSRTVLLATGSEYRPPRLPGVAERWGRSVFHCPFCHGWEVRERALGVLDDSDRGAERALLLTFWSEDITLFTGGGSALTAEDIDRLNQANVAIEERVVVGLGGPGDALEAVIFEDGSALECEGLLVPSPMSQRSTLAIQLGARIADTDAPIEAVEVDSAFRTSVKRLYAAGDVSTTGPPSVASAIAAGSMAAKTIVHDLVQEMHPISTAT